MNPDTDSNNFHKLHYPVRAVLTSSIPIRKTVN